MTKIHVVRKQLLPTRPPVSCFLAPRIKMSAPFTTHPLRSTDFRCIAPPVAYLCRGSTFVVGSFFSRVVKQRGSCGVMEQRSPKPHKNTPPNFADRFLLPTSPTRAGRDILCTCPVVRQRGGGAFADWTSISIFFWGSRPLHRWQQQRRRSFPEHESPNFKRRAGCGMGTKPQYIYIIYFIQLDIITNLYRMNLACKNID